MKYIPADKLTTIIEERKAQQDQWINRYHDPINQGISHELVEILSIITSIQQEQPEVQNGKFVFPKYLYARTKDNKTIDMSYAPQDMTAVEYIRNDSIEQEQPEVDLEKEMDKFKGVVRRNGLTYDLEDNERCFDWKEDQLAEHDMKLARHFYNLGLNSKK